MTKFNAEKTSFSAGIFSEEFWSRTDLDKYASAAKSIVNMVLLPAGAITHRPGFIYVRPTKQQSGAPRLIRFEFGVGQSYILEFGDFYMRVFANNGALEDPGDGIVDGTPIGFPSLVFTKTKLPIEFVSPYAIADLYNITLEQIGDILFLFCKGYPIYELHRDSVTSFSFHVFDYLDGPWDAVNITTTTLTPSGTTGAITITASNPIFTDSGTDLTGMLIRLQVTALWGSVKITSKVSSTVVNATVQTGFDLDGTGATTHWRLGAWSPKKGYPQAVAFYQQRLISGGTTQDPDTLDVSTTGDFRTFSPTDASGNVQDDKGFRYTLGAGQVNEIRWINAKKVVTIGTKGSEWLMVGGSISSPNPLTPTTVKITQETEHGSIHLEAKSVSNALLFVDSSGRKIREFIYNYQTDSFDAPELNLFCPSLFIDAQIRSVVWCEHPNSQCWLVLDNGKLLSLVYMRAQQIVGFAEHQLGGKVIQEGEAVFPLLWLTNPVEIKPQVVCCEAITSTDGTYQQLWAIIKRWVQDGYKYSIEYMDTYLVSENRVKRNLATYMDSCIVQQADTIFSDVVTGLNHLEGEAVKIVADGALQSDKVVTNGQITLDQPCNILQVGTYAQASVLSLDAAVGGNAGSAVAKIKRVKRLSIRFVRTLGTLVGEVTGLAYRIYFRAINAVQNQATPLFTGLKQVDVEAEYDLEQNLEIIQPDPLPITVCGIYPDGEVNEV